MVHRVADRIRERGVGWCQGCARWVRDGDGFDPTCTIDGVGVGPSGIYHQRCWDRKVRDVAREAQLKHINALVESYNSQLPEGGNRILLEEHGYRCRCSYCWYHGVSELEGH
jgi:hypothetical protein